MVGWVLSSSFFLVCLAFLAVRSSGGGLEIHRLDQGCMLFHPASNRLKFRVDPRLPVSSAQQFIRFLVSYDPLIL
jgi:hypothetical protein